MPIDPSRVQSVFLVAVEQTEQSARAAVLDRECSGDNELRRRVEALLRANDEPGSYLDQPAVGLPGKQAATEATTGFEATQSYTSADPTPGVVIAGRYTLEQKLGEGGMGEVWVAKQSEPVKRKVALKLIKAGMDSKSVVQRFEQERQALAMMDHPNIAKVLDGGITPDRRPFFVMELVNGSPLNRFCDETKLGIKERLELFVPICQAVQHAHQKGIVHRDLKPANILITIIDGMPVPKVIDFGVAKATGGKLTDESMSTQFGAVIGTLEYMSPEQAGFSNQDVDTRADIYSLGVILYELLTGLRPFDSKRLKKAALDEMIRMIREEEPSKPSTRLSTDESLPSLAASRHIEPGKLTALLRGELDWVVMKCLEKQRDRRYETASGLGRDIQRYLADEVVEARPPSAGYRMRKFIKRHKGKVIAASLVLAALVTGFAGTTWGFLEARKAAAAKEQARAEVARQRDVAEAEKQRAIDFRNKALDALRATTGTDVELLLGEKQEMTAQEKAYLEAIAERWQTFARQEGTDEQARAIRSEGHHKVAYLWQQLGRREEARPEYEQALAIREKLVADFPTVPDYRHQLAQTHNNLGVLLANLGNRTEAQLQYTEALAVYQKLVADFPAVPDYRRELANSHNCMGNLLAGLGKQGEAQEQYLQALAIQEKLVADFPAVPDYRRELALSHNNVGYLLAEQGKRDTAQQQYEKALAIREKLVADIPVVPNYRRDLAQSHNNLGMLQSDLGKRDEAKERFTKARAVYEKLTSELPAVPDYRRDLATIHNNLGKLLADLGQPAEAQEQHTKAIAIREKLVADFPTVPDYRRDLANSHNSLGILQKGLGQHAEAQEHYKKAIDLQAKLVADFPAVPDHRSQLALSHNNLGILLKGRGQRAEAFEQHTKAVAIQAKLTTDFPAVPGYRNELARSHNNLGLLLVDMGKRIDAEEHYRKAIAVREKLAVDFPTVPGYRIALGGSYCNFGNMLRDRDQTNESLAWFDKAITMLTLVIRTEPRDITAKDFLRNCHWSRAKAYDQLQRYAEAVKDWEKVVEFSAARDPAWANFQHGLALDRAGDHVAAKAAFERGLALREQAARTLGPDGEEPRRLLAIYLYDYACVSAVASGKSASKQQEYADRAMELLQQAVKTGWKDIARMKKDTQLNALRTREDFQKLLANSEADKPKEVKKWQAEKAKYPDQARSLWRRNDYEALFDKGNVHQSGSSGLTNGPGIGAATAPDYDSPLWLSCHEENDSLNTAEMVSFHRTLSSICGTPTAHKEHRIDFRLTEGHDK